MSSAYSVAVSVMHVGLFSETFHFQALQVLQVPQFAELLCVFQPAPCFPAPKTTPCAYSCIFVTSGINTCSGSSFPSIINSLADDGPCPA